jgi:hypothetical protein
MSGISFSTPLVRSLLSGEKSQTRRIINLPEQQTLRGQWEISTVGGAGVTDRKGKPFAERPCLAHSQTGAVVAAAYAIGDRCYVKEGIERTADGAIAYRADGTVIPGSAWAWKPRTLPHRYMPKGLARMALTVTNVRIERLHAITFADMLAEGIKREPSQSPGDAWRALWDGLHDRDGERWADNPWLIALTFTVERNADV